jgi:hypothetical protein
VIFFSLVVQGLALPALIALGHRRTRGGKAALVQIDALAGGNWTREETVERMRAFEYRSAASRPARQARRRR